MIGRVGVVVIWAIALVLLLTERHAHADPQPAMDRQLVERMVRATEEQARATEKLSQAMQEQSRATERLVAATERAGDKCRR